MMVTLRLFNRWRVEGNPTNARLTTQDNQRLARPGIVLDSCRNVCAPRVFAARIGGALVNPPIASAARGGRDLKSVLAARKDRLNPRTKAISLPRCNPTAGKVTISIPSTVLTACWSTSLGEISSATAQARSTIRSATASPGKRWPPVPPQAMAMKGEVAVLLGINSFRTNNPSPVRWERARVRADFVTAVIHLAF